MDSIVEALKLRREGIKNSILVLGYTLPSRFAEAAAKNITVSISHFEALQALAHARKRPAFHLKFDTGMHRQGFQEHELLRLGNALRAGNIRPAGVFSHFAKAEDRAATRAQVTLFKRMVAVLSHADVNPGLTHIAATGGTLRALDSSFDMVRVGMGIYGYLPEGGTQYKSIKLQPVLTWKTVVSEVKRIPKGSYVGYDRTERVVRDMLMAVLPVGYWHGIDRGFSSIGEVLIRGKRAKFLGRVSMDMTVVDVTKIPGASVGDEVVLIGKSEKQAIRADEIGKKIGTTQYEVLPRINPLIQRIAV